MEMCHKYDVQLSVPTGKILSLSTALSFLCVEHTTTNIVHRQILVMSEEQIYSKYSRKRFFKKMFLNSMI